VKSALAAALLVLAASPARAAGPLDGRTFDATYARRGPKTKVTTTQLVFADGALRSSAHDALGFGPAPCTYGSEGGKTRFSCEVRSAKQGVMSWKGGVEGDAITGEATWNRVRRTPVRFWFKGAGKK
jgi:hypothetical protein